jgi:hypothetical protein
MPVAQLGGAAGIEVASGIAFFLRFFVLLAED